MASAPLRLKTKLKWPLPYLAAFLVVLGPQTTALAEDAMGTLNVSTATRGATITLDGKEVGVVPLPEPLPVEAGSHVVKVSKPGYTVFLDVVKIKPGENKNLLVDLIAVSGILKVSSSVPQARVYVDGKYVGRTPTNVELNPGPHPLNVSYRAYADVIRRFEAKAGRVARLRAKMVPLGSSRSGGAAAGSAGAGGAKGTAEKKWYQKWWFWASVAGGALALSLSVTLPLALTRDENKGPFNPHHVFLVP